MCISIFITNSAIFPSTTKGQKVDFKLLIWRLKNNYSENSSITKKNVTHKETSKQTMVIT
jgi:hypothetical protein